MATGLTTSCFFLVGVNMSNGFPCIMGYHVKSVGKF